MWRTVVEIEWDDVIQALAGHSKRTAFYSKAGNYAETSDLYFETVNLSDE